MIKKNKTLLILGGNLLLMPVYKELSALGYFLICVDKNKEAPCKDFCDKFLNIDFSDIESLYNIIKSLKNIIPVAVNDYGVSALGKLENVYKVKSYISNIQSIIGTQKFEMRKFLTKIDIKIPKYQICSNTFEIKKFFNELKAPIILKPSSGIGGANRGVIVVEKENQIKNAIGFHYEYYPNNKILVEECIDTSSEYSVDCILNNGRVNIIMVGENFKYDKIFKVNKSIFYKADIDKRLKKNFKKLYRKLLTNYHLLEAHYILNLCFQIKENFML